MRLGLFAAMLFASRLFAAAPELFIDPGHGGAEPGVHLGAISEAEIVMDIASQLQAMLKAEGLESALSRSAGEGPAASTRVAAANASGAKAMLSLHMNHSPTPSVRGPRIFIPKAVPPVGKDEPRRWNSAAGQRSEEAKALANELARTLNQSESARVNVQNLNLVAFKGLAIPGVVVELGFLSHAESRARFEGAEYRRGVAERLANAVIAWARPAAAPSPTEAKP